jgi:hypothetical protein
MPMEKPDVFELEGSTAIAEMDDKPQVQELSLIPTRQTAAEQDSSLDLEPESLAFTSQETFQTEIGDSLSELKVEWGTASLDPDWRSWSLLHPSGAHGEGSDDVKTTLANFCDHLFHKSATFHRLSLPPLPEAYPDNIMLRGESSTGWPPPPPPPILPSSIHALPSPSPKKVSYKDANKAKPSDTPNLKFKDAVGRKFSFPWHLLIKQSFVHVEPNDAEPSEEEFLSRPSSITSVPSQSASSRTSISQNSSGEDTSSQSSSSFASSTQDSSGLASLDSNWEPSTEEFLLDSLSSSKSRLIDKLMKEFHVIFSSALDLRTCAETQSGSSNNTTAATQPSTLQPHERGAAKGPSTEHSRGWRKDEGGGDQDDDDAQRRRKKANKPPDADQTPNVRFACPFFKHNPRQHKGRACRYPGFKGVHRMKYDLSKSLTIATNALPGNIFIGAMSRFIATDATTSFRQKMNCKIIKGCPSLARST